MTCWNEKTGSSAAQHDHANILCLGGGTTVEEEAKQAVDAWLTTPFGEEDKYLRRLEKIQCIEGKYFK